ncbi:hypothetical protein N7528_010147 [Penicillium herquei]|nr:hypothetical protein N7528_010147 [Penicillium herquei]
MFFFTSPQTNPIAADEIQPISGVSSSKFSLDIPQELADELIGLFFDKVQPWLPLLHKPRFEARYMNRQSGTLSRLHGYSIDEALIFYGMFALSARFSDHSSISHLDPTKRGAALAVRAREICDKGRLDLEPSSLLYLQGCILLAFYMYASEPYPQGWILTGVCVRMAYELGIGTLDPEQNDQQLDATQWSADEELRRVWWLIWELDTFGSTISKRPYSIDWRRMMVKLPVSDEAWFSNTIVQSAVLLTKPSEAWKTLRDSENQDQRAWFLVANYIMARVNDAVHAHESISEKERQELSRAVACFELALPKHIRLNRVTPNPSESSSCNFIVSVHLMLTTTRFILLGHDHKRCSESCSPSSDGSLEDIKFPYQNHARIISRWPPDHIALCHPFIACILLPKSFGSSIQTWERNPDDGLLEDMATLVISRFAEYWQIGNMILRELPHRSISIKKSAYEKTEIMDILKRGAPLNDQDRELAKRFALYFPSKGTKSTQSPTSDSVQQNNPSPVEIQMVPGQTDLIEERQMPANNTLDTNPPIMTFAMDPVQPSPLAPQGFSIWPEIGEFYYDQGTGLDFMAL